MFCGHCGTPNDEDLRFCTKCGKELRASAGGAPSDVDVAAKTVVEPEKRNDGDRFIGRELGGVALEKRLGAGAMGAVYKGRHVRLETEMVVKVILPELLGGKGADQYVERFHREARLAAKIRHPNVITVHDVDRTPDGTTYMVLEFVDGETLEDRLEREGRLGVAEVARLGAEIADGLGAAHELGVVHRDVKPANVLIERRGGHAKVADFGLAKSLDAAAIGAGLTRGPLGTPLFMAPEVWRADHDAIDGRVDLYALGVALFQLLTGKPPFGGKSMPELMRNHLMTPLPAIRDVRPDVSPALERTIASLCAKSPDDRPATAAAAAAAIRTAANAPAGDASPAAFTVTVPQQPPTTSDRPTPPAIDSAAATQPDAIAEAPLDNSHTTQSPPAPAPPRREPSTAGSSRASASAIDAADAEILTARAFLDEGRSTEAALALDRALAADPRHDVAVVLRADLAVATGRGAIARSLLERAAAKPPPGPASAAVVTDARGLVDELAERPLAARNEPLSFSFERTALRDGDMVRELSEGGRGFVNPGDVGMALLDAATEVAGKARLTLAAEGKDRDELRLGTRELHELLLIELRRPASRGGLFGLLGGASGPCVATIRPDPDAEDDVRLAVALTLRRATALLRERYGRELRSLLDDEAAGVIGVDAGAERRRWKRVAQVASEKAGAVGGPSR